MMDQEAYHALCCAMAESTRGHNRVRNTFHAGCSISDHGAAMEVEGLIPSRGTLRPADVLTNAVHETSTVAVDIGIMAPHALDAGLDCTETMKQKKMRTYEQHMPELQQQSIVYCPATFSSYGRRHCDTSKMLLLAAQRAAWYRGLPGCRSMLKRWHKALSAEIWRHAAKMVAICLLGQSKEADYILG